MIMVIIIRRHVHIMCVQGIVQWVPGTVQSISGDLSHLIPIKTLEVRTVTVLIL